MGAPQPATSPPATRGTCDPRAAAAAAVDAVLDEVRVRARLVLALGDVGLASGDGDALERLLRSLLVAAAQGFSPDDAGQMAHGVIALTTGVARDGRIVVELSESSGTLRADHAADIFDPAAVGGSLVVEGAPGQGSVVRVILPPARRATRHARAPADAMRILVVDDDALVCRGLERLLGGRYDVTAETHARAALRRLAQGERYDAVVCDVMMPDMSGPDLFAALGDLDRSLQERVVFMTGGAFTPGARAFLTGVSNPLVDKPFDRSLLESALQRVMAIPPAL